MPYSGRHRTSKFQKVTMPAKCCSHDQGGPPVQAPPRPHHTWPCTLSMPPRRRRLNVMACLPCGGPGPRSTVQLQYHTSCQKQLQDGKRFCRIFIEVFSDLVVTAPFATIIILLQFFGPSPPGYLTDSLSSLEWGGCLINAAHTVLQVNSVLSYQSTRLHWSPESHDHVRDPRPSNSRCV